MYEVVRDWYDISHLERNLILDITIQLFDSPGCTSVEIWRVEREFGDNEEEFTDTLGKLIERNYIEVNDDNTVSLKGEFLKIYEEHTGRRGQ